MAEIRITPVLADNIEAFVPLLQQTAPAPIVENKIIYGAVMGKVACGVAVCSVSEGIATLDTIYVSPFYRKKGAAGRLLDTVLEHFRLAGAMSITAVYSLPQERTSRYELMLLRRGFGVEQAESSVYLGSVEDLLASPLARQRAPLGQGEVIYSFADALAEVQKKQTVLDYLQSGQFYNVNTKLSALYYKDKVLRGTLVMEQHESLVYHLAYLQAEGMETRSLINLMAHVLARLQKLRAPEEYLDVIAIQSFGDSTDKLISRLLPDAEAIPFYYRTATLEL